jgi:hypothetical protein
VSRVAAGPGTRSCGHMPGTRLRHPAAPPWLSPPPDQRRTPGADRRRFRPVWPPAPGFQRTGRHRQRAGAWAGLSTGGAVVHSSACGGSSSSVPVVTLEIGGSPGRANGTLARGRRGGRFGTPLPATTLETGGPRIGPMGLSLGDAAANASGRRRSSLRWKPGVPWACERDSRSGTSRRTLRNIASRDYAGNRGTPGRTNGTLARVRSRRRFGVPPPVTTLETGGPPAEPMGLSLGYAAADASGRRCSSVRWKPGVPWPSQWDSRSGTQPQTLREAVARRYARNRGSPAEPMGLSLGHAAAGASGRRCSSVRWQPGVPWASEWDSRSETLWWALRNMAFRDYAGNRGAPARTNGTLVRGRRCGRFGIPSPLTTLETGGPADRTNGTLVRAPGGGRFGTPPPVSTLDAVRCGPRLAPCLRGRRPWAGLRSPVW